MPLSSVGRSIHTGEAGASAASASDLMPVVYQQLASLAARYLSGDSGDLMLEPAVLVHEAYLCLARSPNTSWNSPGHFFAVAAMAMRKILIDHARQRRALKRGFGHSRVSLELVTSAGPRDFDIREIDDAINALEEINPRASRVVELRFFAGLKHEQVAQVLGVSRKTVVKDWAEARAWLARNLSGKSAEMPGGPAPG